MKNIRCPRAIGEKWLKDLRSGEYKQGKNLLVNDGAYCCLGVLQMGVDGDVERNSDGESYGLPTHSWLIQHGIEFFGNDGSHTRTPFLPVIGRSAADANDNGYGFGEISDATEETMEFTD